MPQDDTRSLKTPRSNDGNIKSARNSMFAVPRTVKQLFSYFPLTTYPANFLPIRAPTLRDQNTLYVFSTEEEAENGAPSFNPGCLKWQTYLKMSGVVFRTVASNNHASPSGALPFLLPSSSGSPADPIIASRFQKWAAGLELGVEESSDVRVDAYMALVDHRIRRAWLYSVYLTSNFDTIAVPLYILPATSSSLVRLALAHDLHRAAESELLKTAAVIDAKLLMEEAKEAFGALETLLSDNDWFFSQKKPSLIDAAVFAYTQLLLDENLGHGWSDRTLLRALEGREKLIRHRNRLLEMYY